MNPRLQAATTALPLVAILRGLKPDEAAETGKALYDAGFRMIEVPLNSPRPLESIRILREALPHDVIVGAGTVLSTESVHQVSAHGGDLIVMPHADVAVIHAAKAAGLICMPGVSTPTEAFAALEAGADALKAFPGELLTPPVIKAWRAVLPPGTLIYPVGGITPDTMQAYLAASADGFGIGSAIYKPGLAAAEIGELARTFVAAWRRLRP